jgi:hypothetical protein
VLLAGLGVDQVRLQGAGVGPEQGVGQRAVAPEEPGQVQPGQQLDQRVDEPVGGRAAARVGEQRAVGGGVVQVAGDQDGVGVRAAVDDDPDHLHGRHVQLGQRPQQPVLAAGQPLADRLQRVQLAAVGHEPHDVPGDAALADLDQPLVVPVGQRLGPGQGKQARCLVSGRAENKPQQTLRLPWPRSSPRY